MKKNMQLILICGLITCVLVGCKDSQVNGETFQAALNIDRPSLDLDIINSNRLINIKTSNTNYAPINEDNSADFISGWNMQCDNGSSTTNFSYNNMHIDLTSTGNSFQDAYVYRDGITLQNKHDYSLIFNVSSSIERNAVVVISNANTGANIYSETISLTPENNTITVSFPMTGATIYNGRIAIQLGNDGQEATTSQHDVLIKNLGLIDNVYSIANIKVNQVGYLTNEQKRCVFPYNVGDLFFVINSDTNETAYVGSVLRRSENSSTGETNYYGEFTNLLTPGTYYIRSQIGTTSYPFTISDKYDDSLFNDSLKMLSLQRCGSELGVSWAGYFAHVACHNEPATVYGSSQTLDVTGGWHDAGDYGRYVITSTKTVSDLMMAYIANPSIYTDDCGIGESGNGTPDILDEAKYELDWLLKMQEPESGGVYSKVVTVSFPEKILPVNDHQPLYVMGIETASTASFSGTMALAYITYKQVDPDYANKCLEAAKKAFTYIQNHPDLIEQLNPANMNAGEYTTRNDNSVRFYAATALYAATGEDEYLNYAKKIYANDDNASNGTSWVHQGCYGKYLYLTYFGVNKDDNFYDTMYQAMNSEADTILGYYYANDYNTTIDSYQWGSNSDILSNGTTLFMAYDTTGNVTYKEAAIEQLNYVLGKNCLNTSFVIGYGSNAAKHPHHRISSLVGSPLTGAVVGGPNSTAEDNVAIDLTNNHPQATVYVDNYNSYSTNEVAIYYNSPLIYLLGRLK